MSASEGSLPEKTAAAIDAECEKMLTRDDEHAGVLWHYTDAAGLKGIVEGACLHATHYGFTNDVTELVQGEVLVRDTAVRLSQDGNSVKRRDLFDNLAKLLPQHGLTSRADVFLACFSDAGGDALTQWAGYGHRGAGYAIGLEVRAPPEENDRADLAVAVARVEYHRQAFLETVSKKLNALADVAHRYSGPGQTVQEKVLVHMLRECAVLSPRFKHNSFEHECEWRAIAVPMKDDQKLFRFRERQGVGLVPYVEVPITHTSIRHVVCGPAPKELHARRLAAVRMLLAKHDLSPGLAQHSASPFRT
jgi:hypothetical protein